LAAGLEELSSRERGISAIEKKKSGLERKSNLGCRGEEITAVQENKSRP
jgi:hypothetical protein